MKVQTLQIDSLLDLFSCGFIKDRYVAWRETPDEANIRTHSIAVQVREI